MRPGYFLNGRCLVRALVLLFIPWVAFAAPNIPLQEGTEPPPLLSQTGLFLQLTPELMPVAGIREYAINQALWVDHAQKQRFVFLPPGEKVTFSPLGAFGFPVGTIFVKHFRMEVSRNVFRNLETRVLVNKGNPGKWAGYTYAWEGGDARLVGEKEKIEIPLVIDETAAGGPRTQKFKVPTRIQCMQCHNESVGFVRSFITPQLNRGEGMGNQLEQLARDGLFDRDIGSASAYEAYAAISDPTQPVANKVKAYLDVNCAHCHNPSPFAMCEFTGIDFRYGMMKAENLIDSGHLVPGKKEESEIFRRMSSVTPFERMPYIGSDIRDETALSVVGKWIEELLAKP